MSSVFLKRRWDLAALLAAAAIVIWLALRMWLLLLVGLSAFTIPQVAAAFAVGAWFDLATIAYLLAPVLLVGALLPSRWRASRVMNLVRWLVTCAAIALLLFGAISEIVFWDEFTTRFNFIAVDYLIYTSEVIGNIRQSYPVALILGVIAGTAALATWLLSWRIRFDDAPLGPWRRIALLVAALALPAGSYFAASVDQMSGAGNEHALEISGNGLFSLAAAMRRNELDYDRFYQTIPQEEADTILLGLGVERLPLSKAIGMKDDGHEPDELGPFKRNPKNVVLISVESLSAEFVGSYGSDRKLTPRLDALAAQGLKFETVYATGTRTVRGLEALSLGTPPIPGQAILRRPNNDHLIALGQLLKLQGFNSYFIYGGYGYFDNMNAYFASNDYKVVDRTDFPRASIPMENVWGVADEALFDNALRILDEPGAKARPFFAHIMTTTNHRPYTYPDGRIDIKSPGGRDGAVKYTDYAIGRFIDQAKSKPWFKDTLFVIVADHCASAAGKTKLPVPGYRIPLILYAPDMLPPGVFRKMTSQMDLPPTLLDLLGARGDDHYFGESIFENQDNPARAFISNYQELGYFKNGLLTVLSPLQKSEAFRIDPATYAATPVATDPVLLKEAIAYYQTSSRAFKRNALKSPKAF
ncbi:MAG: sulfatase-like hydrolase/transferase [Usitatibacter sp.]